jgi:type I restriction enzyme S subunit
MALRIGSGLPNIQKKDLERFQILIPNVDKQQRYAKFFDYLQHKEDIEVSILNQWQLQKQYLLGQMFI